MSCTTELGATLRQVRDEIEQVFGPFLGVYILPDDTQIPAIWTRQPDQLRPDWRVAGTEAILDPEPERTLLGFAAGSLPTMRRWTVEFTNFDPTTRMGELRLQAFRAYPSARQGYTRPTDITYERLVLELSDPVLITPL